MNYSRLGNGQGFILEILNVSPRTEYSNNFSVIKLLVNDFARRSGLH
jgi:hypothetical protein